MLIGGNGDLHSGRVKPLRVGRAVLVFADHDVEAVERDRRSVASVAADLRRLGVAEGDLVMVHASLRSIGPVQDGADGVIDALQQVVGTSGTLLMLLGARDDWAWVNQRPEAERPALLADAEPFDHLVTPADPEFGVLAEVFRRRAGVTVSDHPENRFAATGRLADELLEKLPWHDYYGPGSALERLVDADGKVLRLGADMDTTTVLHYAEHLASVRSKRRVRRHRLVAGHHGAEVRVVETLDDEHGIVDYPGEDYFAVILREYLATQDTGPTSQGMVGKARSELIDASDLVAFAVAWMDQHLG